MKCFFLILLILSRVSAQTDSLANFTGAADPRKAKYQELRENMIHFDHKIKENEKEIAKLKKENQKQNIGFTILCMSILISSFISMGVSLADQ